MVHEADGIHVFWHSDVLLHDAGSAVLEAPGFALLVDILVGRAEIEPAAT